MCGRFTLTTPDQLVAEAFGLEEEPSLAARYNIAPTQDVAAIVAPTGTGVGRRLLFFRWGFSGGDADDAPMLINARSETASRKPTFKEAFQKRRCLIPADGFYEWRKAGARREPYHVRLRDRAVFAFAGLWRPDEPGTGGGDHEARHAGSCVILTTTPNELMRPIHDRMPAILPRDQYARWLDPRAASADLERLLAPFPATAMDAVAVSAYVNSASAEGPRCLEPERQGSLFD